MQSIPFDTAASVLSIPGDTPKCFILVVRQTNAMLDFAHEIEILLYAWRKEGSC